VAFPFVLAAVLGRAIVAAGSRRNYFAVALLGTLGIANLAFYLEQAAVGGIAPGLSVQAALYLVVLMVVVIGGRVVPSFTANALPAAGVRVSAPALDWSALGFTLLAFAAALAAAPAWLAAPAAAVAAALHAVRQWRWAPWATRRRPILWVMHISHAWIPIGLALLALAALDWVALAVALHAFGAGAIGGMIMAMITRTALGHTGRALEARWPEIAAYVLVHAAAAARVAAGLLPEVSVSLMSAAGHLWALAFLLYFVVYLPRLVRPRVDGKPG
jgi:uncharacterized protein involved in response to NO